jgi:plasmid stabilization system protein ParE
MSYTIFWSPDAESSFDDKINYLTIHWTEKEIRNFRTRVRNYLALLSEEPHIGKTLGTTKNLHIGLIIKRVSLIYRILEDEHEVELVLFIDNRQDPKKIKKFR